LLAAACASQALKLHAPQHQYHHQQQQHCLAVPALQYLLLHVLLLQYRHVPCCRQLLGS
jgi:hypothetical protein